MQKLLPFFISLVIFTSCGDLLTKKTQEEELTQFATCKMDTEAITQIFAENIQGELYCLEKNLNLFIDVVESDRPGYLSKKELLKYVEKNLTDVEPEMLKALGGVFDINSLLFGDDKNYISRINVSSLIKILVMVNEEIVGNKIYEFFTSIDKMSFFEHNRRKSVIYNTFLKLGERFYNLMKDNNRSVDVNEFIEQFRNNDNKDIIEYVESVIFLKKAFLGGVEKDLSAQEVERLAKILGDIGKVVFDFVNLPNTKIDKYDDEEVLKILKEDVATIRRNFYYKDFPDHHIISFDQIAKFVDVFFPEFNKYIKYKKSFLKLKEVLVGSNTDYFTAGEIDFLLNDILDTNLGRGVYFYRTYNQNANLLDVNTQIYDGYINSFILSPEEEKYREDFNRIVRSYHYFKGDNFAAKFNYGFYRNSRGVFEVAIIEDIVTRFLKYFGQEVPRGSGAYKMTLEQFQDLMGTFKDLLEGEEFISAGRVRGTAETITLISSLFLPQSDGDSYIDVKELTEFGVTLLSGMDVSLEAHKELIGLCSVDDQNRYTPQCFRRNFKKLFEVERDRKKIKDYLPELNEFVNSLDDNKFNEFIINTEAFTRTCSIFKDGSDVPMSEGDALVIWTGLMSAEQTLLRFDKNKDGVLMGQELEEVYKIFKDAIKGLMPSWLNKTSKDLFYYLIKYKRVPVQGEDKSLWQQVKEGAGFVGYLIRQRFKKIQPVADRITFAAILKLVAENSSEANTFDCETLR